LIEKASFEFVALADQDDVWLPNHLLSSIKRLSVTPGMPSMTFSSVTEFGEKINLESIWPSRFPGKDIRTILTENVARGCTFVLNSKAINLIKLHKPKHAIMHDWWILLLIYSSGRVTWSTIPEIRYRIHQNNSVGRKSSFRIRLNRFFKNLMSKNWVTVDQSHEILINFGWSMSSEKRHEIGSFLLEIGSPLLYGRWKLVLWHHRYRSDLTDELALRLAFLLKRRGPI
jgi:hypothetical protein